MRKTGLASILAAVALVLVVPALAQAKPADRDGDGMSDRWERRHHVRSANADPDRDRVDNRNEYVEGTNPRDRDTDNDRRPDGREDRDRDRLSNAAEDATGNNPRDRDTDNDGVIDGREQAGVVTAYEDGVLTIDLANGGQVSAKVTDRTRLHCASETQAENGDDDAQTSQRPGGGPRPDGGEGGRPDGPGDCHGFDDSSAASTCPEGTLKVGAKIHEARMRVTSDGATWVSLDILT